MSSSPNAPVMYADLKTETVQWIPPQANPAARPPEDPIAPPQRRPARCLPWCLLVLLCVDVCLLLAGLCCVSGMAAQQLAVSGDLTALKLQVDSSFQMAQRTISDLQEDWDTRLHTASLQKIRNVSDVLRQSSIPALLNSSVLGQFCQMTPRETGNTPVDSRPGYSCSLCPANWSRFRRHCYLVSTETGTWEEAREACLSLNARLLVINSPAEQEFAATLSPHLQRWIGLSDTEQEGQMKWVDGTVLDLNVTRGLWNTGQPDDYQGREDCVHFVPGSSRWNALSCEDRLAFICERRLL
ncbi:C-type lectin domain family 10 member A-like isoform X2 [Lepisosteus oculatus]|uniref:C-type lectin domain family 10 member A-like isoform X2 n=1 Tax=Lepisosteus oculatus TaxID=7918 RepID=UPI0007401A3B|nr:PREDICTED: CD209 antigen-like protein C isoform X2 [Lepisosteus oculatus]